jgi:hypothetical protein
LVPRGLTTIHQYGSSPPFQRNETKIGHTHGGTTARVVSQDCVTDAQQIVTRLMFRGNAKVNHGCGKTLMAAP